MKKLSPKQQAAENKKIVDEFRNLQDKLEAIKPSVARYKHLAAVIESWYPDLADDKSATADGNNSLATVSARKNEREVRSYPALRERLGDADFMKYAEIGLGTLDELLKKEELPTYIVTTQTGNRSVKAVPKPA